MLIPFNLKSIDNNAWLWAKVGLTTFIDTIGIKHKVSINEELFKDIKKIIIFIGYPRSGHSIVGSLIDAHPNAMISHRLDALKYIEAGYNEREVFYLIVQNSRRFAKTGRKLTGYQYKVPNGWHGKFDTLEIIGDQEAKWTSQRLGKNPDILQKLIHRNDIKIKFIHVIRNPYDNITTWSLRTKISLNTNIQKYFSLCNNVTDIISRVSPTDILCIRHENLIYDFETSFKTLCNFLDLSITENYFKDCASIVYKNTHKSRYKVQWSPQLIEKVQTEIENFSFLKGYSYEN